MNAKLSYDSPEFVKRFGGFSINGHRNYPRKIESKSCESLTGHWWFENLPQRGLSGGSKLRAYRRSRGLFACSQRYGRAGQFYVMFAGPVGILP